MVSDFLFCNDRCKPCNETLAQRIKGVGNFALCPGGPSSLAGMLACGDRSEQKRRLWGLGSE